MNKLLAGADGYDVIQWLFDAGPVARAFGFPVHVSGLVTAGQRVANLIHDPKSVAADVCEAYTQLAGSIGPEVMKAILQDEDAIEEVNHSGQPTPPAGGDIVLFVDKSGRRVVVSVPKEWGKAPVFRVE